MSETLPAHSPVGASTAKRMLICPLSVGPGVPGAEDDESEHAALGTAVHSLIERSFTERTDAWHFIGQPFHNIIATKEMANGAQVMLDAVRRHHPYRDQGNFFVEKKFHCPTIHPLFFGTCDALYIDLPDGGTLHVWDYKNGAGVIVEVERNEQTMYYACGALEEFNLWAKVKRVVLHIVQPNGFHPDGRVRSWTTTPEDLAVWLEDILVPGIERAMSSNDAVSGDHCRFCPKRFGACPALVKDMEELETMMQQIEKVGVNALQPHEVGRFLDLWKRADIVGKAALKTGFGMLQAGNPVPGWKLVASRVNRSWKDGAEARAHNQFGVECMTVAELKSPAQIDELPLGSTFTAEWAQKPPGGLTMAPVSDSRVEVSRDTKSLFTPVVAAPKVAPVTPTLAPAKRRVAKETSS